PMKRSFKAVLYGVFLFSLAVLILLNFSAAFLLVLLASVLLFFYFWKIESNFHFQSKGEETSSHSFLSRPVVLPVVLGAVSLLFLVNPIVSQTGNRIGEIVSGSLGITNTEVRPTLSTTLSISKAVLS